MFEHRNSSSHLPVHAGASRREPAPRGSRGMPSLFGGDGPLALLRQLDEDMNRLFDEFAGGRFGGGEGGLRGGWLPQLEVCERDGKLHVQADLPGMKKEDIKVDLADGMLTIQGERRAEREADESQGLYRSERSYGRFVRSIPLPDGIDLDSARASFRDGVLDICFDAPQQKTRTRSLSIGDGDAPAGAAQQG